MTKKYLETLPAERSVATPEGAVALLQGYLANGESQDLPTTAACLSDVFRELRSELVGLWSDWVYEGGESDYVDPKAPKIGARWIMDLLRLTGQSFP